MISLRLLFDEHYPAWLVTDISQCGLDATGILRDYPWLLGASDIDVLRTATGDRRIVVTEDIITFPAAIAAIPDHCGVIFCRSRVLPRTRPGLAHLAKALTLLADNPPPGLGSEPLEWWLADPR